MIIKRRIDAEGKVTHTVLPIRDAEGRGYLTAEETNCDVLEVLPDGEVDERNMTALEHRAWECRFIKGHSGGGLSSTEHGSSLCLTCVQDLIVQCWASGPR